MQQAPSTQQYATPSSATPSLTGSDDILGFRKDVFIEMIKWGAIAGAIAGVIDFVGGMLTTLFSWFGIFALAGGAMFGFSSIYSLLSDVIQSAFWGVVSVFIVVKFYEKFPFKSLFMKFFGIALIIDVIVMVLFGFLLLIFAGPLSFIIMLGTLILADFVFAKIAAGKVGPLTGLQ